ncbi:unnamed protein product [Oikopleura dioica]|uniref:Uncharacterized protein n=1 Tax=Oikopleura dioica TaxID=34765 RepID=E4XSJ5_OIKDI|nr:unnamed protein product [Oikopleura dioica]
MINSRNASELEREIEDEMNNIRIMEASTKKMQNNLRNLEKEKQKIQKEEDDLTRQYEALRKKNDQLEAKLAREQKSASSTSQSKDLTVLPAKTKWLPSLDFNEDDLAKMTDKEINSLVIKLEREQKIADGNLKNSEWKLDQEAKNYHEAQRKVENARLVGLRANQDFKRHQQLTPVQSSNERHSDSRASMHSKSSKSKNSF